MGFSYCESKTKAISNCNSFLFLVPSSLCRSGNSESLKIPLGHRQVWKLTNHLICREVQVIRDFFMSYFKGASMSGSLIALRGIFFRSRSRGWKETEKATPYKHYTLESIFIRKVKAIALLLLPHTTKSWKQLIKFINENRDKFARNYARFYVGPDHLMKVRCFVVQCCLSMHSCPDCLSF